MKINGKMKNELFSYSQWSRAVVKNTKPKYDLQHSNLGKNTNFTYNLKKRQ
jgi:hypothetical protein